MDAAVPAGAETASESPRAGKRRVPTAYIVTLVGIALSAWLLPAITRQWDDRQKAHELEAALVAEMASATATAVTDGRDTVFRRANVIRDNPLTRRYGIVPMAPVERNWSIANIRIAAKLQAYFPSEVARWRFLGSLMAELVSLASGRYHPNVPQYTDPATSRLAADPGYAAGVRRVSDASGELRMLHAAARGNGPLADAVNNMETKYNLAANELLVLEERVSRSVLADHPTGYSTTWRDFLRDLVP